MAPRLPLFGGTSPFGQLRREEQTAGCRIAIWIAERPHCRRHFPSRRTGNNRPKPVVPQDALQCPIEPKPSSSDNQGEVPTSRRPWHKRVQFIQNHLIGRNHGGDLGGIPRLDLVGSESLRLVTGEGREVAFRHAALKARICGPVKAAACSGVNAAACSVVRAPICVGVSVGMIRSSCLSQTQSLPFASAKHRKMKVRHIVMELGHVHGTMSQVTRNCVLAPASIQKMGRSSSSLPRSYCLGTDRRHRV